MFGNFGVWPFSAYASAPASALSLLDQMTVLANGEPFVEAGYYGVDGLTGNVSGWIDHTDSAHVFAQPVAGLQVPVPTPSAGFGGRLVAACLAAYYESNRPASRWRFSVDGTGINILHVQEWSNFTGTKVYSASCRNNVATTGHSFFSNLAALIRNGTATVVFQNIASGLTANTPTYITTSFDTSRAAGQENDLYRKGTLLGQAGYTPPTATGDPDRPMGIFGGNPLAVAFPFTGNWAGSAFTRPWSSGVRSAWQSLILSYWGLTP